ncbi:MAG TPA: MopE-related protein [Burkholderiaceae bacterium]|nr:MopE-related protein [Burkholderiaceae bacterium]
MIDAGLTAAGGHGGKTATDAGSLGGQTGVGGNTGGAGAAGGAGTGAGGASNQCDENSPLRQTDVANCGHCFNQCYEMNADATCVGGACQYTCLAGFFDADKNPANGCECQPTNNGVELCDGVDNDCNGMVDDGFDLMSDLNNCGGCSRPCFFPFAASSCDNGVCTQGACLPDFYDRDPNTPGCETSCQKSNGGVEICDGIDNDCNGMIDDNVSAPTITCKSKGVCAGTTPVCMGLGGYVCVYPSTYQDVEDSSKGCDGLDNDCDGLQDEAFGWNTACSIIKGGCTSNGKWVCDTSTMPAGRKCNAATPTGTPEVCDGKDNDCDGLIDELDHLSDSNDALVTFTPAGGTGTITMFAYEASRVDATTTNLDNTHRPCSLTGKKPWSNITKEEAVAACALIGTGWRLCADTEWFDACNGSGNTTFPYGANYVANKCNGYDYMSGAGAAPITTGTATGCVSDLGTPGKLYDMSGNVKEWVTTTTNSSCATLPCYQLRGGAYDIASFMDNSVTPAATRAPGLQCDASIPAPTTAVRLPSVGYRCCHTGALPQ